MPGEGPSKSKHGHSGGRQGDREPSCILYMVSFHSLLCLVGTAQNLSSKRRLPTGQGYEESHIAKDIRSKATLHPSGVNGRLSAWAACPHFIFPLDPQYPHITRRALVIISPNLWWRPVFFDSCQIPLIMSLQPAHSQTHLGAGSLLSAVPS